MEAGGAEHLCRPVEPVSGTVAAQEGGGGYTEEVS